MAVEIREFVPDDATAFRTLNEEWILQYFALEAKDDETLGDPAGRIVEPGGRIFMAFRDERPAGCVALVAMQPGEYEVAKMAVTREFQGRGVGRKLLLAAIEAAKAMGAARLYLETNQRLTHAIHLYESVGFRPLPQADSPYARVDVRMEKLLVE
jgi:GNAT superfamily N-acetyltransferase